MRRSRRASRQRVPILARLALLSLVLGLVPSAVGQSAITYIYDENGRLVAVIDPSADPGSNVAVYRYDAVGNIIAIERGAATTVSILSFAPGCAAPGTTAVIYGTGFSTTPGQNAVTFNGAAATVTAATATQLTATIPGGASSGPIAVTAAGGSATSTRSFTVGCSPPTITGFSPTLAVPGTAVVVDGANFDPNPINDRLTINVMNGAVNAATPIRIDTAVPPNATSGRVSVGTLYGTAVSTADLFVPPPGFTVADVSHTTRMPFPGTQTVSVSPNKIALIVFDAVQGQRLSIKRPTTRFRAASF